MYVYVTTIYYYHRRLSIKLPFEVTFNKGVKILSKKNKAWLVQRKQDYIFFNCV